MKKIIFISAIVSLLLFSPFSASANSVPSALNKYGVIPYNENMIIEHRKTYANDYSHPDYIKQQQNRGFSNYDGKFDARRDLGGVMCVDAKTSKRLTEEQKQQMELACKSWMDKNNNLLVYNRYESYYSQALFFFYTGPKNLQLEYASARNPYDLAKGFFMNLTPEDYQHFYYVSSGISSPYYECTPEKTSGDCSSNMIDISISIQKLNKEQYPFRAPYENHRFFFGQMGSRISSPVFSSFDIIYPQDYPQGDKVEGFPSFDKLPNYYPRPIYNISDKRLEAYISNLTDLKKVALNQSLNRPSFSIYDEKKEREIFSYHGSNLADRFTYDFEEYGKYYLKTWISTSISLKLGEGKFQVHQPVWTEIIVNGGSYAFFSTTGDSFGGCSETTCSPPEYAKVCSAIHKDILPAISCEFNNLATFLKSKLGILWAPVDILTRTASNFQRANAVSCSVGQGQLVINACPISEKFPALYSFLNMASNGVLLFGFVIFLRNQLSGFVSERGGQ